MGGHVRRWHFSGPITKESDFLESIVLSHSKVMLPGTVSTATANLCARCRMFGAMLEKDHVRSSQGDPESAKRHKLTGFYWCRGQGFRLRDFR